jgi:hypothetical protein
VHRRRFSICNSLLQNILQLALQLHAGRQLFLSTMWPDQLVAVVSDMNITSGVDMLLQRMLTAVEEAPHCLALTYCFLHVAL